MKAHGFIIALALLATGPATAQRAVLDDSMSPIDTYSLHVEWQPQEVARAVQAMMSDRDAAAPPLTGAVNSVDIRLDTSRYVGRNARIYLVLPTDMAGLNGVANLVLSWQARGMFESGSVGPGQAALLFEGEIDAAITGGVLDFSLTVDPGDVSGQFVLEPFYEIEIIS